MLNNVEWGKYRIGDLFQKLEVKKANKLNVRKYRNEEFNVPVVYCKYGDNGIMYWGRKGEFTTYENVISIVYNGAVAAGKVYAQKEKTGILAESYFIKLKDKEVNYKVNLFLSLVLEKVLYHKYSREYLATWNNKVENDYIYLPILNNKKINYEFMESFINKLENQYISELEAQRNDKLNAFLSATNLKDCSLTENEIKLLEEYDKLEFAEFDIVGIFSVKNTGNILSRDIKKNSGSTPYLCASSENNAVSSYIKYNESYIDKGNCIFIGGKTFVVSYQEKDFYSNDSHNLVLYLKDEERTKLKQFYLATCINKSLQHKYSWGDSISKSKINKDRISLPIKNGKPYFEIMEEFISAIQKLVIKDIIDYEDMNISVTKKVIDSE